MHRALISMAVFFSLFLTAVHGPSVAHEVSIGHSHSQVSAGDHDHVSQPASDSSDQPDEMLQHHHCSNAWCPDSQTQSVAASFGRVLILPGEQHTLASLAQAPPTEPPSA